MWFLPVGGKNAKYFDKSAKCFEPTIKKRDFNLIGKICDF